MLKIGVFDSGVGGLTVLNALMQLLPEENYIYESTDKGHPLKTKYNNAPSRAKLKHYDKTFDSYLKYNTGY